MGESSQSYLYVQTRDRLYSVMLDDGYNLSDTLNVEIKFPEEEVYPIGGALHKVNGELWMIGGEKMIKGTRFPYMPFQFLVDRKYHFGTDGNCRTVFHKKHNDAMVLLRDKLMTVGKPNPVSAIIGNKLYVLPGRSLFSRRRDEVVKYMNLEEAYEVYDIELGRWSTFPRLPGVTPFSHFVMGEKIYVYTGLEFLSVYDTRHGEWYMDDGKFLESFSYISHSFPDMGAYLKVDNMHVMFSFHEGYVYAYLVSFADDVHADKHLYVRCFQCFPGFYGPNLDYSNNFYGGIFVPLGDGKMCCVCSHDIGANFKDRKGFFVCITIFSVAALKIDPERSGSIFQSEFIAPCRCRFLDVTRISFRSYMVQEGYVDCFIMRALLC